MLCRTGEERPPAHADATRSYRTERYAGRYSVQQMLWKRFLMIPKKRSGSLCTDSRRLAKRAEKTSEAKEFPQMRTLQK